jgi:RNA recognition motif-containing protein
LCAPFSSTQKAFNGSEYLYLKEDSVGKKLHVGNLTSSVSSSDLQEWLAAFGTVQSAQVVSDRATGRSKGFGFVEMDTDAQAHAAIQGLHEQDHDGRRLMVSEAKPRVARTSGFAGGRLDGSARTGGGDGYGGSGARRY